MSEDTLREIIGFDGDITVKASAGTGKTTALTSKYLAELKKKTDKGYVRVGQLAAITFTEKAAAEMRKRLREMLTGEIKKLRAETSLEGSSANMGIDDKSDGAGSDKKLLAHLITQRQALQTAYISTVHSFCARLLKENPLTADVDPAFTVIDEWTASELLERAARKVALERLRRGDKGTERLTLMLSFASKGEGSLGLVETLMRLIPLARSARKTPEEVANDYRGRADRRIEESADASRQLLALVPSLLSEGRKNSLERKYGAELEEMHTKSSDKPFSSIHAAMRLLDMGKKLEEGIKIRTDKSSEAHVIGKKAVRLMRLAAGGALEIETKEDVKALASILGEVMAKYNEAKLGISALDFDDLEEKALNLLRNAGDPEKRRFAKFQRVLVDEFQDTNELQREIITALARPGGLFIVGDMKQSIYGFRGTDHTVFKDLSEEIIKRGGRSFQLRENRRSTPSLIRFTNGFFQRLMSPLFENGSGFVFNQNIDGLLPIRPADGIGSVIRLSIAGDGNSASTRLLEAASLARLLKEKVEGGFMVAERDGATRPARYRDIALLLRKFGNLSVFENAFRHAGVPYQVVKGRGFYNTQEALDITSVLSFIDNQSDTLSLLSALRSPLAGLSDVTLYSLCRNELGDERDPASIILGRVPIPHEISDDEKMKIRLFINQSGQWRKGKGRLSISELIEEVLSDTGYQAVMMGRFQGEQKAANLQKLIDQARAYERNTGTSLTGFLSAIRKKQEKESGDAEATLLGPGMDAVSIMTIHQSKGLEFPIVAVGDMGSAGGTNSGRVFFHPRHGLAIQYYNEKDVIWAKGPVFLDMEKLVREAGADEEKRLLYVAMTRARDTLILSGPLQDPESGRASFGKWVDGVIATAGLDTQQVVVSQFPPAVSAQPELDGEKAVEIILSATNGLATHPRPDHTDGRVPFIHLTVTGLTTFRKCPRLYYYRIALGLPQVSSERAFDREYDSGVSAVELGSRIHSMMERAVFSDMADKPRLAELIEKELGDLPSVNRKAVLRSLSMAFTSKPLEELASGGACNVRREAQLAIRFSADDITLFLQGAADLLWATAEGPRLVDYKTAVRPPDEAENLFQLRLYASAIMAAEGYDKLDAHIVYLGGGTSHVTTLAVTANDIPAVKNEALDLAREIARLNPKPEEDWTAKAGKHCEAGGCFYRGRNCHAAP